MNTRSFVAILAALLFASCSSPVDGPDRPGAGAMAPIVTGIRITYETGQFAGNWGNPTDGPDNGTLPRSTSGLMVMAPNPSVGKSTARFALMFQTSNVRLWISPARLAGAFGSDLESIFGAQMAAPRITTVKTLESGTTLFPGTYAVSWDGTDDAGNRVPSGFYRIYLSVDGTMYWRDLMFFATLEEAEKFSLYRKD